MDARELLLIAVVGAVARGTLFAQPRNVTSFIDEESCNLNVSWLPAEPPNSNCILKYGTAVCINGTWTKASKQCLRNSSWKQPVPLGKEINFKVKTFCNECEDLSDWNDVETFSVKQNGAAGTGARNLNCTWWNRNYMECLWLAGEKASPDTSYKLFCWHYPLAKGHQCKNITRDKSFFRSGFELADQHVSFLTISVHGDSGNIQPSCLLLKSINSLVKFDPPVITYLSKNGSEVFLNWTGPIKLNNLHYQVEVDGVPRDFKDTGSAKITIEPDRRHTFRVRVRSEEGQWSEWSNEMISDDGTSIFPILLFILIPLCLALLLVILLIYLKRIKLLILPKIPDPEKILKHMFEEQNEDQPTHETTNNEETYLLTIVEPAGNEK